MDRPIECSECKQQTDICFIEVTGAAKQQWNVCDTCPFLEGKLSTKVEEQGPICSTCETSLQDIKRGSSFGCMHCYTLFEPEMTKHCGRGPMHALDETSFDKLGKLHKALGEALKQENYEEAAWLRDQIRNLKDNND